MDGVGQNRDAARPDASGELDDRKAQVQDQGQLQVLGNRVMVVTTGSVTMAVIVIVTMCVLMLMSVIMIMSVIMPVAVVVMLV